MSLMSSVSPVPNDHMAHAHTVSMRTIDYDHRPVLVSERFQRPLPVRIHIVFMFLVAYGEGWFELLTPGNPSRLSSRAAVTTWDADTAQPSAHGEQLFLCTVHIICLTWN